MFAAGVFVSSYDKTSAHFCYTRARLFMLRYVTICITNNNNNNNVVYGWLRFEIWDYSPQGGLPRGRCDKSSRAEFQNSMWHCFVFQQNGFQRSLVEQRTSDPNLLPYFWKAYCQNTAKSGQELCYWLFYGCSRQFYEIRQKELKIELNLENNMVAIIFTGKACCRFTV